MALYSRLPLRQLKYWIALSLLFSGVACSGNSTNVSSPQKPAKKVLSTTASLPGQQMWKMGASSFLFGTNDTYEWSEHNVQTDSAIQDALRHAGFTLMRSFFPDNANDAVIERRIQTIENSGAHCLGVITNIADTAFNEHLVHYLGKRCLMYEFGNEPDYDNITLNQYLAQWNNEIPKLRQINSQAVFIGPVTSDNQGKNDFMRGFLEGVNASHVLPDAVSFHWYPCYRDTEQHCLDKADSYKQVAQNVSGMVHDILGKNLPVGITEWNYDPGNPPPSYGDNQDFITKFSTHALASMVQGGVAFACQFDAASYSGYGRLDMFNVYNDDPKPQYYAIKSTIEQYRPSPVTMVTPTPPISSTR